MPPSYVSWTFRSPPYPHFECSQEIFLALRAFLLPSQKHSRFLLSHIRHYPLQQERSLDFARDDVTEVAFSQHIRCTLRKINPFPHTVISSAARNLPCTPSFLAPFAKGSPFSLSHIGRYTGVPERSLDFARDDDAGIALSKHIRCTLREINPFPPPSFRAQREIFLALCCFLLPSQKVSPFLLSHIGRYTSMQERSLHFGRDDVAETAFFQHILYTRRGLSIPPPPSFRAQREIFLALRAFLLLSQKVSPFPLSHIGRYTAVPERSLDFARDDDTGIALSQHILYTMRGISPL